MKQNLLKHSKSMTQNYPQKNYWKLEENKNTCFYDLFYFLQTKNETE